MAGVRDTIRAVPCVVAMSRAWNRYVGATKHAQRNTVEEVMNRGLIATIVGILVIIVLVLVIMRMT